MTPSATELRGFAPGTAAALDAAIVRHGRGAPGFDPARPPIAVFDWDNTCICNDIGDASFDRMATTLDLRLDAAELEATLPERLGGIERRGPMLDLLARGRAGDAAAARAFRAETLALYEDMGPTDGPKARYKWVAAMLAGRTEAELEALGDATIEAGLATPVALERVEVPGGRDAVRVWRGLRLYRPMARLVGRLLAAGWDVRVVSASAAPLVRAFARRIGLGPERVIAVRLDPDPAGRLRPRVLEPFTYMEGKLEAIDLFLGRRPKLVAGDSPGDLAMLRASEDARLVVARSASSEVARIAAEEGWLVADAAALLEAGDGE
jgi:phosphoserine phosphatase